MPPSTTPEAPSTPTKAISRQINKVAVLGAGTMGSRIAAHLTNAGIPVVMLDIVPPGTDASAPKPERNKIVLAALDGLKKSKPAAFYSPDNARLLTIGNFDDDLALIADCDWIIEVVAENMEIKRALLDKVAATSPRRLHHHQQHQRPSHPRDRRRHARCSCAATGSARTSSIPRATCGCSKSSPRPTPTPQTSQPSHTSATSASAKPSSTRTTRPTSSPTASALFP